MRGKRLILIVILQLWLSAIARAGATHARDAQLPHDRPNIIYILLDDMDYFDVGAYGSPDISTPTMDALAAQGMRFDEYYTNGPVCSPTRAAILSGDFPTRYNMDRVVPPNSYRGIPGDVMLIPQMLKNAGYYTGHIGKWHVGTNKMEFLPTHRGFDYSVRHIVHERERGLSYFDFLLSYNDKPPTRFAAGDYLTETLTNEALKFIRRSHAEHAKQPFFLNLWYHAPHEPLEVPYDFDNSKTRYCINFDLAKPQCPSQRGTFAALMTTTDQQIKRILELLDRLRLDKNTLVIVTSDNGGVLRTHSKSVLHGRSLRGFKDSVFDGGLRVPFIVRWPRVIPKGAVNDSVIASFDLLPTLAQIAHAPLKRADGKSFLRALRGNVLQTRANPLFWATKLHDYAFENSSGVIDTYAVRDGDWKLVYTPADHVDEADTVMLFNLRKDPEEKHNLIAVNPPRHQLKLRLFGTDIIDAQSRQLAGEASYQAIVNELQNQYYAWRRRIGDIDYRAVPSPSGVSVGGRMLKFSGGVATVARDTRFDFNDGAFSFLTRIKPKDVGHASMVAEKPGSWRLFIDKGTLELMAYGRPDARGPQTDGEVVLSSPIEAGREYHVAFTITSWGERGGEAKLRLFVDGAQVDDSVNGKSIRAVRSRDVRNQPMIFIGNNESGTMPFHGEIRRPRMTVVGLYPSEVRLDYARLTR